MGDMHPVDALIIGAGFVALGASLAQTLLMGAWRLLRAHLKGDVR